VVSLLRAAGAVIMGKTVTTEFATRTPGKTRNPHDPAHTAGRLVERVGRGGRSEHGPAGARQPDHRLDDPARLVLRRVRSQADARADPAPRHVPAFAHARSRRPVRANDRGTSRSCLEELATHDERGSRLAPTRPRALSRPWPRGASARPHVRVRKSSLWDRVDTDAREAFAELVADLGDRVEEVELVTPTDEVLGWQRAIGGAEIAINLGREWDKGRDKLSPALRARIEHGREVRAMDYLAGPWPHSRAQREPTDVRAGYARS